MDHRAYFSGMVFFLAAITFLLAFIARSTVSALVAPEWLSQLVLALLFVGIAGMVLSLIRLATLIGLGKRLE